jgi:hypothetical protein
MELSNKKLLAKRAKKKASRSKKSLHNKFNNSQNTPSVNFNKTENYINENWNKHGYAHCLIVRDTSDGRRHLTTLLVDTWALGVKDIYATIVATYELEDHMARCPDELTKVSDSYMFQFITGAINYASDNGHKPHKDYKKFFKYIEILKNDPNETYDFEYGCSGNPVIMEAVSEEQLAKMDLVRG